MYHCTWGGSRLHVSDCPCPNCRDVHDDVRAALVRAVVARDWASAIAWDGCHIAEPRNDGDDSWDEIVDHVGREVAALPCAEDFVAALLGEVKS